MEYRENKNDLILSITFNADVINKYYFDLQMFAAEDEGRTEEPTELKKRKAREEGNVPKSQELVSILVFLFCFWTLSFTGKYIWESMVKIVRYYFENMLTLQITKNNLQSVMIDIAEMIIVATLPIMIAGVVFAILANLIQTGFIFTTKKITPNFGKIFNNIGQNFRKMFFSRDTVFNLVKSILKVVLIFTSAGIILYLRYGELVASINNSSASGFMTIWNIIFWFVNIASVILLLIALMDYLYQRYVYIESLKMTKQELKEELKEQEGNPEIKARIRQMERDIMRRNLKKNVEKADVVITNPTHIAVALGYDPNTMPAPQLLAKGEGLLAERIKQIARENDIFIIENKPLARQIYYTMEEGDYIPEELFKTVANILAIVYSKKNLKAG